MKILVTGAGGFIGSHLVESLLKTDHSVRAFVHYNGAGSWRFLEHFSRRTPPNLEVVLGDVGDARNVSVAVQGCDIVLHLAALIGIPYSYVAPESYVRTNVIGTLNILEACRHHTVRRVVVTSTSEVYGTAQFTPITEEHPLQGQSPYSATKIGADKLAESYYRSFDVPVVTLRPFNTFGPRQSSRAVIPTILSQALSGAEEIRLGSLDPKRDLTFVEDTARAFILAAEAPGIEGKTIHFGNGKAVTVGDLAGLCLKTVGSKARIVTEAARQRPDKSEVGLLLADPCKAKQLLHWSPQVSLEQGLERTADYIKQNLNLYRISQYTI
jgi:NAD dependent epimerase/dehydratase